jgi:4-hydroxy-3-methylbut-2-enyl diphosphate reductase
MTVSIDKKAGFCFGVEFAVSMAEMVLEEHGKLYCLGDIVHNDMEVSRLKAKGLEIIDHEKLKALHSVKVLIRAHGEPPETYQIALQNNIELIDASCPVVLKLQNKVKMAYDESQEKNGQLVIYGKPGHAEVVGLNGQTGNNAIIVSSLDDLQKVDFTKPITLYTQTTKSTKGFKELRAEIAKRLKQEQGHELDEHLGEEVFDANDTICRQVSNREPQLKEFLQEIDILLFVSGKKSSNGKSLLDYCKTLNDRCYLIENELDIDPSWFKPNDRVGISGATSTPGWLMEQVKMAVESMNLA